LHQVAAALDPHRFTRLTPDLEYQPVGGQLQGGFKPIRVELVSPHVHAGDAVAVSVQGPRESKDAGGDQGIDEAMPSSQFTERNVLL